MPERIKIADEVIKPGEDKQIQLGIARLPTYTNIDLNVRVIRAKEDGPVVLLSGGLHGDEINGIEIVRRLIRNRHCHTVDERLWLYPERTRSAGR